MGKIKSILEKYPVILQLVKFGIVGVLNTAVDFGILNLLLWLFKVYSGPTIIIFNIISFTLAVVNSYLWNKYWTFGRKSTQNVASEFTKFVVISIGGAIINSGIVYFITTIIDPYEGLSEGIWANAAKIVATVVVLAWNFVGYKLWAFRDSKK